MNTDVLFASTYYRSSNRVERLVLKKRFWLFFILISFAFPIYRSINRTLPPPAPILFQLPEYILTNQFGKTFGSKDLTGKIYLANFIFTRCPSSCKEVIKAMSKVQKRIRGLGTNVGIVTFSVDPEFDTPNILYKYSRENQANPFVWSFLTGTTSEMEKIVIGGFKLMMDKDKKNPDMFDIAHSEKIAFVDEKGQVRGFYSIDNQSIDKLMIDLGLLINLPKDKRI